MSGNIDNNLLNEQDRLWAAGNHEKERTFSLPTSPKGFYLSKKGNEGRFKSQHSQSSGVDSKEKETSQELEKEDPELVDSSSEDENLVPKKKGVKRRRMEELPDLSPKIISSPPSSQLKFTRSTSRSTSRRNSVGRTYQFSSAPHLAEPETIVPDPELTNSLIISRYLNLDEHGFDPLFFTLSDTLKDDIVARQKDISSDWPLVVTPSVTNIEKSREPYERGVVQAQISNAAQMALSMLIQGDHPTAMMYILDTYALSTRAATMINNERVNTEFPGSSAWTNMQEVELVRPRVKELLTGVRSSATIRDFFLAGGGTGFPSPQPQESSNPFFMQKYSQENLTDRRSSGGRPILSEEQMEFIRETAVQLHDAYLGRRPVRNRGNNQTRFAYNRIYQSRQRNRANGRNFRKPGK
jgi:hypothetical protein